MVVISLCRKNNQNTDLPNPHHILLEHVISIKVFIIIISVFIVACNNGLNTVPNSQTYFPYTVNKLDETKYFIEFRGTPLNSEYESKQQWNYKAEGVCQGAYRYISSIESSHLCSSANNFDCMQVSIVEQDTGKLHPVVTGIAHCSLDDSPKIIYSSLDESDYSEEVKEVIIVKELNDEGFYIEYAGTPDSTFEEVRLGWHERAEIICGHSNYQYRWSKNSMWHEDIFPTGENVETKFVTTGGGGSGAIGAAGGAIECMLASILFADETEYRTGIVVDAKNAEFDTVSVQFPVVEGSLICNSNER